MGDLGPRHNPIPTVQVASQILLAADDPGHFPDPGRGLVPAALMMTVADQGPFLGPGILGPKVGTVMVLISPPGQVPGGRDRIVGVHMTRAGQEAGAGADRGVGQGAGPPAPGEAA